MPHRLTSFPIPTTLARSLSLSWQYEKKKSFRTKVAALEAAKTEPEIVKGLDDLTQFVLEQKGLPMGVKKQALITEIRKVKKAGKDGKYWNKDAEISYEQLIYSINYQQVRVVILARSMIDGRIETSLTLIILSPHPTVAQHGARLGQPTLSRIWKKKLGTSLSWCSAQRKGPHVMFVFPF